jgi:hypothetical protein
MLRDIGLRREQIPSALERVACRAAIAEAGAGGFRGKRDKC